MKLSYIFFLYLILNASLSAQRLAEREIIINPLFTELQSQQDESLRWMPSISAWGGFGYYAVGDNQHAWDQKLGVLIEIFRLGENSDLFFVSHIEFIANDNNDIRFNPSALIWEEGFMYTHRFNQSFLQIGYFHRCKHDVDNLSAGYERSMIFGGLLCKYIFPVFELNKRGKSYLALRSEISTICQDYRVPNKYMEYHPSFEQLIGITSLNFNNRYSFSKNFGIYLNTYASLNFFGNETSFWKRFNSLQAIQFNGGISFGFAIEGNAHFRIGLNAEYISDNMIDPIPTSSTLLSIGVFVLDPKAIL
ncbi:MAG: hypothetical protein ABFS12_16840 [Bacteroidota bacterium]